MPTNTSIDGIIGIWGLGEMGEVMRSHFERRGRPLRVYDETRNLGSPSSINEADVIFICVPTPYHPVRGFDDEALESAVSLIEGSKIIVIKSTVLPGTTEAYQVRYSQHCFLFNPEFMRKAHARTDFLRPDRQLIGYTAQSRHLSESILAMLPAAPYVRMMSAREAEMAKYMTNAYLALKVTFANEMFDLASALDIDYTVVRDAVAADLRIGSSHMEVSQDGYRGFGNESLGKDAKALLEFSDRLQVPLRLLRTADRVNASLIPPGDGFRPLRALPVPVSDDQEGSDVEIEAA